MKTQPNMKWTVFGVPVVDGKRLPQKVLGVILAKNIGEASQKILKRWPEYFDKRTSRITFMPTRDIGRKPV